MYCIVFVEDSCRFLCREQIVVVVVFVVAQMEGSHSPLLPEVPHVLPELQKQLEQSDEAGGEKRAFWS